jgi:hypothetical protein
MTPAGKAHIALAAAVLPLVLGAVAVRPAGAQDRSGSAGFDGYSLTALASGARTSGDVGAAGGLATLDTASASVTARLDSAPSAAVLAAPYEPGTLFRTVVGQVNGGAGEQVLDVPDAEAQFPGQQTEASLETVPPAENGPVSSRGGQASARASELAAEGSATGEQLLVEEALDVGASTSSVQLVVDPGSGTSAASGRTVVSRVLLAGVLELRNVVATAEITADGDQHTPTASLTIGGASVAGQGVVISDEGVTAIGSPVLPGQTVEDLTEQANSVLSAAGIEVRTLGTTQSSGARSATADTGGVAISLVTPVLPGGIAGNRLEVVVGGIVLTATDSLALPALPSLPPLEAPSAEIGSGSSITTFVPGTAGTPAVPGSSAPEPSRPVVAAPPATLVVGGRTLPAAVVLAAFAVWQFLTLGTATLYAVVERRRRISGAAA